MIGHMRVQFIGSGDAFGSGGRLQACILVEGKTSRLLLDCGTSCLIGMKRLRVDPNTIDAIVVTHLHGDHFGGIPFFVLDAQLVSRRKRPLILMGPRGISERTTALMDTLFPGSANISRDFEMYYVEFLEGIPMPIGSSFVATPYEVVHASGAPPYAVRLECDEKVVAYSGDTQWTPSLILASRDSDLLICEAYFFDKSIRYHLDYATLQRHRRTLGCRRLILTHLSEDMLRRRGSIDAEVADDGTRVEL